MGEQNLHCFKAESDTGELMRGSFCEVEKWLDSKSVPA